MSHEQIQAVQSYLWKLQSTICDALTHLDKKKPFRADPWESQIGYGISAILENGSVFEKAGVNVSHVKGHHLPPAASIKRPELAGCAFEALGLSLVIHPMNPYIPTTHANIRFFMAVSPEGQETCWFGGGFDLTPYYGFIEDCAHWHRTAKKACDPFGLLLYPKLKVWCDEYFYLPHRKEARGIGGIFFDDFFEINFEHSFNFMKSVGDHFLEGYQPIVEKRKETRYSQHEKEFQCYRRGRYVEFNLVYDRGTLFGLQSGGRTESILMSLPPQVSWRYDWRPEPGTPEARLYTDFLPARNWIE